MSSLVHISIHSFLQSLRFCLAHIAATSPRSNTAMIMMTPHVYNDINKYRTCLLAVPSTCPSVDVTCDCVFQSSTFNNDILDFAFAFTEASSRIAFAFEFLGSFTDIFNLICI